MKKLTSWILIICTLGLTLPVSAQFAKPENAVKYRQGAMFIIGQHMGRLGAMAQGQATFDAKLAAESASVIEFASKLPWQAFGEGTDKAGIPTRAKSEIWTDKAKFADLAEKMQVEASKLSAAAKSGNLDNLKGAMRSMGATCKGCHDDFQAKL